ncbi:MAG: metal-dependent hydrolase [Thermoplasmatota archaeon]
MNPLTHLGTALLLATVFGFRGRKRWFIGIIGMLPDADVISSYGLYYFDKLFGFDHATYNTLFYLLEHREFTHSFLFIIIVMGIVGLATRKGWYTAVSGVALFSHFTLDYFTTWKVRPGFPLDMGASTMGVLFFFDPVINITAVLIIPLVILADLKGKGKLKERFTRFHSWFNGKQVKFSVTCLLVILVYIILMTGGKTALVAYLSEREDADISFRNTYPLYFSTYLTAYPENETHYKVIEASFIWGPARERSVPMLTFENVSQEEGSPYQRRAMDLYGQSLPGEIDLPVCEVRKEGSNITVQVQDARNFLLGTWAYFKPTYRFHFQEGSTDDFWVEVRHPDPRWLKVENNRFE